MKKPFNLTAALLAALCIAGCARNNEAEKTAATSADQLEIAEAPTVAGDLSAGENDKPIAVRLGPGLQRLAEIAIDDLSLRLGVSVDEIQVADASYVTWRDGSIGCPMEGYAYTQALVNGSLIKLVSGGKTFRYHSGGNQAPSLCESPNPQEPLPYAPGEA